MNTLRAWWLDLTAPWRLREKVFKLQTEHIELAEFYDLALKVNALEDAYQSACERIKLLEAAKPAKPGRGPQIVPDDWDSVQLHALHQLQDKEK